MLTNTARRQVIVGAVPACVAKRSTRAWRTQDERGPPKALLVATIGSFG